jgi:hypothetical protein
LRKRGRKRLEDGTTEDGSKKLKIGDLTEPKPLVAMILLTAFLTRVILPSSLLICVWLPGEGNTDRPIKYPIDDLLIRPAGDDPARLKRPRLVTDFRVPRYLVGDLLMVWDFCSSFGRLLKLSPFSLTDLENAIYHKETSVLLVEMHAAMFHLLMKDQGDYFTTLKDKKRKLKVFPFSV